MDYIRISILLGILLTTLLIVSQLHKFYDYYLLQKEKKKQELYDGCPIGITVEEKMDTLIGQYERSWERGTRRINRERIDNEFNGVQATAIWILLRQADADPTLNGEVKQTIKKFAEIQEKKAEFIRNEVID